MSLFLLFEESSEELIGSDSDITVENKSKSSDDNNCHGVCRSKVAKSTAYITKIAWSFVLVTMALFFLAAAYVQHNDPDPYIWMPAYLIPCFVNLAITFFSICPSLKNLKKFWKIINWVITLHICYCYAIGFWTLIHCIHRGMWDDSIGKIMTEMVSEPEMQMEEAKELMGLCLVVAWLSFVSNGNFLKFGVRGIMFASALTALPIVSWILVEKLEEDADETCF